MAKFLIRPPRVSELPALSELQLRSKAHWGYDAGFMEACRDELTLHPNDLNTTAIAVAERDGHIQGVAQVGMDGPDADLLGMFVDPPFIGTGAGKALFLWAVDAARETSATRLMIEADPQAEPFYLRMGARRIGTAPSGSIPGRSLPLLEYPLR